MKKPVLLLALAASFALTVKASGPDETAVPSETFSASRYEALWTKSPFAVATAEAVEASPDYSLVGIAQVDGVSYASVIERQPPQNHFLISSDKPTNGMLLTSITHSHDGSDTYAIVQKDGQPITLKLEQAPPAAPMQPEALNQGAPQAVMVPQPGSMTPQIPMPGSVNPGAAPSTRPLIRIHRPQIHLPQQQPVQAHPAPPPPPPQ